MWREVSQRHYSYEVYADPATARTFDERRFGGPIGELIAATQARVLANFVGRIRDRTILDVGTGTGRAALLFAGGGARVTAVDASEQMLQVARSRAGAEGVTVNFQPGDALSLPFHDRSFDVVACLRVVMHSPQWKRCIAELCRVADQLVILDYPSASSAALLQAIARRLVPWGRNRERYQVFSHREIADQLALCGFKVRSVHRQFVLPIAVHKAIGSRRFTMAVEELFDRAGLLKLLGSPITLVAERCAIS
jgi:SAM-dependent methyltransferase